MGPRIPLFNEETYSLAIMLGRSLGVVPRNMAPTGYLDLKQDDYEDGTLMDDLQQDVITLSKRAAVRYEARIFGGDNVVTDDFLKRPLRLQLKRDR